MKKIRAVVVGYGNIGRYVIDALECAEDFEIAGIVRRSGKMPEGMNYKVAASLEEFSGVDVAILSVPSRKVRQYAAEALALGINTIDCFDIHTQTVEQHRTLDRIAKANGKVSVMSAGWDPGSDSMVRALLEACAPNGITYTNFGPGMSMGHTVATKAVEGVKAALSMTIPVGTGLHRRMVYVEVEEGADFNVISEAVKHDPYFVHDETHVIRVENVDTLIDMGHGVNLVRKGVSGKTHNQLFEFNMRINNPAVTSQIMVSAARAALKQLPGCYTLIELPLIDFLPGDKEVLIGRLV